MSPKRVVGCRDESRFVEGCWGFPYLKSVSVSCFFGFFVSWFFGFVGMWLLGLLVVGFEFSVSWFRGFKVSRFQIVDVSEIHLMLVGR